MSWHCATFEQSFLLVEVPFPIILARENGEATITFNLTVIHVTVNTINNLKQHSKKYGGGCLELCRVHVHQQFWCYSVRRMRNTSA